MISIEFIIAATIVALIPGTGVIYTLSIAINSNRKNMFYAIIGCTLGIVPHIIGSILVLYFLLNIDHTLLTFIKYVGVLYLFYLSYMLYKSDALFLLDDSTNGKLKILLHAITINLLNPKLMIFLISFIPQYIVNENEIESFIYLSLIFMLITFIVFIIYGLFASYIKDKIFNTTKKKISIQKIFSLVFFIICIQILVSN